MRTFRAIFLFSCLCFFLAGIVYSREILLAVIKYQITNYCKKTLNATFECSSLTWKNGEIICENGAVIKNDPIFYFSKARFVPKLNWKKRELQGDLQLSHLHLINKKNKPQFLNLSAPTFPFFSLNVKTKVPQAEVLLYDDLKNPLPFQRFIFDLEYQKNEGCLTIDWEGEKLKLDFVKNGKNTELLQAKFQSHSLSVIYDLFAHVYSKLPEPLSNWKIYSGKVDGKVDLSLVNTELKCLKSEITLTDVEAENHMLQTKTKFSHFAFINYLDFTAISPLNGEFLLQNADITTATWNCKDLDATVFVKEGKIESSYITGNYMGVISEIALDWSCPDTLLKMNFQAKGDELLSFFPHCFQEPFKDAFAEDFFDLTAHLTRAKDGLELKGSVGINEDLLEFGCHLGLEKEEIKKPSSSFLASLLHDLSEQFYLTQKRLGWFHGKNFPLEKFLSPFLLKDMDLQLSGRADFQATFDERYVVISYQPKNFALTSPYFSLQSQNFEEGCVHTIDLQNKSQDGFLSLKNAIYYQKNRDLLFSNAMAMLHFENNKIYIQEIKANWDQLQFNGEIEIQMHALDDVDLMIVGTYLEGPAVDLQRFLTHFSDSIFWQIPLDGKVVSKKDVFKFQYHFSPDAELITGQLQGDFFGVLEDLCLNCSGHVSYDLETLVLDFISPFASFHGVINEDVFLEGEDFLCQAKLICDGMQVTHFNYGQWEGKGNFRWDAGEIAFQNFLIKEKESKREFNLSGVYQKEKMILKGDIDQFTWNFSETFSYWKPRGEIFGSGAFEWGHQEGAQVHLAANFKQLEFGGIHFGDGQDLKCYYSSAYGILVEGLEVEIPKGEGIEKYKLGRFSYNFKQQKILFEGFDFSLPPEKLPWVAQCASDLFPGKIHPTIVDWVEELKQNEPLEGRISVEMYPDNVWIYLTLKDGTYYLSDRKHHLKNFLLLYDPLELNIWTQCFYQDDYYWLHLLTDSMTMSHGKLAISERELSLENPAGRDALIAKWERRSDLGWCLHSLQGNFHGLSLSFLTSQPFDFSSLVTLEGCVSVKMDKIHSFLTEDIKKFVTSFSLGGEYAFDGKVTIPKSDFSNFTFLGRVSGSDISFGKVNLGSFSSHLNYSQDRIICSNLFIKDWAGRLSIGHLGLIRNEEKWGLHFDTLKLEDFRLSRLRSPWVRWEPKDKPFFRSFFIRNFDLNHFEGELNDLNSLKGQGSLAFTNLPKRTLFDNLLFLPTEITARIGLDLTALIPVRGIVDYEIKEGKIYFNELKEMYSDGKRSRFYLAEGFPAYVDFSGNLNLKLKMKQYNLLMKLAEFFTISVKGTLLNPKYTFSNQDD